VRLIKEDNLPESASIRGSLRICVVRGLPALRESAEPQNFPGLGGSDGDAAGPRAAGRLRLGAAWNARSMHLDSCWDPTRVCPPFVEWMTPKG
jgi:hypothetical protein